jgi:hypothetical protein
LRASRRMGHLLKSVPPILRDSASRFLRMREDCWKTGVGRAALFRAPFKELQPTPARDRRQPRPGRPAVFGSQGLGPETGASGSRSDFGGMNGRQSDCRPPVSGGSHSAVGSARTASELQFSCHLSHSHLPHPEERACARLEGWVTCSRVCRPSFETALRASSG